MTNWFQEWFNEEYLALYADRDQVQAGEEVEFLCARFGDCAFSDTVLDVACGAGRHLVEMRRRGVRAFGADLSPVLVRQVQHSPGIVIRADMRALPFPDQTFSAVTNFFTSFGYFALDEENEQALGEWCRVLRRGGYVILDYLNSRRVRRSLVPFSRSRVGEREVEIRRTISPDGRRLNKVITFVGPRSQEFHESIRLFDRVDLVDMLERSSLAVQQQFGDFRGAPLDDLAERVILVARRKE